MIQELIELTEKKLVLLKELLESQNHSKCDYHLYRDHQKLENYYFLHSLRDNVIVASGPMARIQSFMSIRSIKKSNIYTSIKL